MATDRTETDFQRLKTRVRLMTIASVVVAAALVEAGCATPPGAGGPGALAVPVSGTTACDKGEFRQAEYDNKPPLAEVVIDFFDQ